MNEDAPFQPSLFTFQVCVISAMTQNSSASARRSYRPDFGEEPFGAKTRVATSSQIHRLIPHLRKGRCNLAYMLPESECEMKVLCVRLLAPEWTMWLHLSA